MHKPILLLLYMSVLAASPALAAEPEQTYTPEELRADFDQLYRQLRAAHFDVDAYVSRRKLDAGFATTRAELNQALTAEQARVKFQRFAALVHMGHTRAG